MAGKAHEARANLARQPDEPDVAEVGLQTDVVVAQDQVAEDRLWAFDEVVASISDIPQ